MQRTFNWLVTRWNWPYAAAFAAVFLLALTPLLLRAADSADVALFLIFLQLPMYMIHQLEEHAGDRFRRFVNQHIGGGYEVLSRPATFVINSVGVWGVDLLGLYLAIFVNPALGLMAIWLTVINAVAHVGQGIAMRCYNPGLGSAALAFLPVGIFSLWFVSRETHASPGMQILGVGVAVLAHVLIVVHVKRELTRLRAAAASSL